MQTRRPFSVCRFQFAHFSLKWALRCDYSRRPAALGFDHAMARVATDVHSARPQMDWLTMTDTTTTGPTLRAWARARSSRFGRWLFARAVSKRAPYFGTIK